MYLVPTILLALVAVADAYPQARGARKCRPRPSSLVAANGQQTAPVTTAEWTATAVPEAPVESSAAESATTSAAHELPSPSPQPESSSAPQPESSSAPPPEASPSPAPGGGNVLLQGSSGAQGTYYYQHSEVASCNGTPPNMHDGDQAKYQNAACLASPIAEMNTDSIVAIPYDMLQGRENELCGKEIEITVDGKVMKLPGDKPFFVWDGCVGCKNYGSENKVDFSIAGASFLAGGKCDNAFGISWRVLDNQVVPYEKAYQK